MESTLSDKNQLPTQGFPLDGNPWRIDWINWLKEINTSCNQEPMLRIYISRIKEGILTHKVLLNESLYYEDKDGSRKFETLYVDVKVGQILFFPIGSVWINGKRQFKYGGEAEEFEIKLEDTELVCLDSTGQIKKANNTREDVLANHQYRIPNKWARENSWVVLIRNHSNYHHIVIPSSVIFQSCYVTSPKAASKMIYGQIGKIIDLKDSGYTDEDPTLFRVHLFKDFANSEAPTLINLVTDPAAQDNLNNLEALNPNFTVIQIDQKKLINVCVNFPFSNAMKVAVIGRIIKYPEKNPTKFQKKGFLVTEIRQIRTDFQFEKYLPIRKNDGSKGLNPVNELQEAFGVSIQKRNTDSHIQTQSLKGHLKTPIENNRPPDQAILPNKMEEIKNIKDVQRYKNCSFKQIAAHTENNLGLHTEYGNTLNQGEYDLKAELSPPAKLEDFFELLDLIHHHHQQIRFTPIEVNHPRSWPRGIVNFFEKKINGLRSWHLTEDGSRTRGFIVAECHYTGTSHYLIDVESKGSSATAIAYITHKYSSRISSRDFRILMLDFAKKHGWSVLRDPKYTNNWHIESHDHVRQRDHLEGLARRILDKMKLNSPD